MRRRPIPNWPRPAPRPMAITSRIKVNRFGFPARLWRSSGSNSRKDRGLQHIIIWELGQDLAPNNPYSLLYRAYTKNLGLAPVAGDYDADRDVDTVDYAIWRSMFGQTGFGRAADGNGNQAVDAGDYVIWRKTLCWCRSWFRNECHGARAVVRVDACFIWPVGDRWLSFSPQPAVEFAVRSV